MAEKKSKPKSLTVCPVARSLEHVGEWWSMLILRDCMNGSTRFDEFEKNLGIAPNMLTRRLTSLVESGVLTRRLYSEKPPRYEYLLTDSGRDFFPVIAAMMAWGNRHFAPEGVYAAMANRQTGARVDPVVVDGKTGMPLTVENTRTSAGPIATEKSKKRYESYKEPPRA